jgi:hypothetical protein
LQVCATLHGATFHETEFFKWWIVWGAQVLENYTNPNVSDPIRETILLQKTFRTDISALVIAELYMLVLRVIVWDSREISGLIFRGGNAVRLLGRSETMSLRVVPSVATLVTENKKQLTNRWNGRIATDRQGQPNGTMGRTAVLVNIKFYFVNKFPPPAIFRAPFAYHLLSPPDLSPHIIPAAANSRSAVNCTSPADD